ncbi:hypothetical protein JVV71_22365, partial [Vibrio cholerae O1]|nr:hypothetical protein [Vibrio cholerae O1]
VTADSRLTLDFGPLGTLLVPAGDYLPLGLGVSVDIGEIPVSGAAEDTTSASGGAADSGGGTIDALGGDIASYASL